jgi:hypothetical protein
MRTLAFALLLAVGLLGKISTNDQIPQEMGGACCSWVPGGFPGCFPGC